MSAIVCSLNILWHCLSLGLEWKVTFLSPVATAEFSKFAGILSAALSQHHLLGLEIAQLEFHHLHYLCSQWCFLRPTWLHIPEPRLTLGEWSHHHDYLGCEDLFCTVLLCILAISSSYILLLLGPYHFCPLLSPALHEMFPWYLYCLEEISCISHPVVFLYFFALITEEGFLISPCYSLDLCIQIGTSFLFSFVFNFSSFLSSL